MASVLVTALLVLHLLILIYHSNSCWLMNHGMICGENDETGSEIVSPKRSRKRNIEQSLVPPLVQTSNDDTPTWLRNYIQMRSSADGGKNLHQIKPIQRSLLLLAGLPGSGKSTFANALQTLQPAKYAVVNQDRLKTRQKCLENAKRLLIEEQKCIIIDRCNFDHEQRRHFFELIKTFDAKIDVNTSTVSDRKDNAPSVQPSIIPVDCIVFDIDAKICEQRCLSRRNHPTLKKKDVGKVLGIMRKSWSPPNVTKEPFRHVFTISNDQEYHSKLISMLESVFSKSQQSSYSEWSA